MATGDSAENEPLISARLLPSARYGYGAAHSSARSSEPECGRRPARCKSLVEESVVDVARYRTQTFSTWSSFLISDKTVWKNPQLWWMIGRLAGVSVVMAVLTILIVQRPALLKVGKFTDVSKFLNVVVGLLLSFFLSSSIHRWYTCVNGFLKLLDSIRNLQTQFIALGVPLRETCLCMRYGLVSAWLLFFRLSEDAKGLTEHGEDDPMWDVVLSKKFPLRGSDCETYLSLREAHVLRGTHDPPLMLWVWVAALVGRLAQDGMIPPMASPTYGRIMNLCQESHASIREVTVSIMVQYPLIYTHMLATLVHFNNMLNAVTFGIVLGLSAGTVMQTLGVHALYPVSPKEIAEGESQRDVQTAIVTFMYSCCGPIVYQALLIISMAVAQPFDSEEAAIPLDRFINSVEQDLKDGFFTADNMSFKKPSFAPGHVTILTEGASLPPPASAPDVAP